MRYFIAIIVVVFFVLVYVVSYMLNSKIKIDCDKETCEGCNFINCIHHKEEE